MNFVLATNNEKKLSELRNILTSLGVGVVSLAQAGANVSPEETGRTFEENALIKARAALEATGLAAIADDSGLEVDALVGMPGVLSARYGAPEAKTDDDRNVKLLMALSDVPEGKRSARFVCAAACVFPDNTEFVVRGTCEGEILKSPSGKNGFGYDPLFYVKECAMTMAEMPAELKNVVSHRAKALKSLREEIARRLIGGMEGIL
jgi:XTP/dITP diphosphohydrolase